MLILGKAYTDLAANYRWQQRNLSYTTSELRFSFDPRVFTQIKCVHQGGSDPSSTESSDAVRSEIQALARGMDTTGDFADKGREFEPTVILYQGSAYTDETLIQAVLPLCAVVAREQRKISGDGPVRGITLSSKYSGSFQPFVLIS